DALLIGIEPGPIARLIPEKSSSLHDEGDVRTELRDVGRPGGRAARPFNSFAVHEVGGSFEDGALSDPALRDECFELVLAITHHQTQKTGHRITDHEDAPGAGREGFTRWKLFHAHRKR